MTPSTQPRQCERTDLHAEHEFYDGGFYRRQCPGLAAEQLAKLRKRCPIPGEHSEHRWDAPVDWRPERGLFRHVCSGKPVPEPERVTDDAYARGVAEGRRQATERFIAECRSEAEEHWRNYWLAAPPAAEDRNPADRRPLYVAIGLDLAINMARHRLLADGPWESGQDDHAGVSDVG